MERAVTLSQGNRVALSLLTQIKQKQIPLKLAAHRAAKRFSQGKHDERFVVRAVDLAVKACEWELAVKMIRVHSGCSACYRHKDDAALHASWSRNDCRAYFALSPF